MRPLRARSMITHPLERAKRDRPEAEWQPGMAALSSLADNGLPVVRLVHVSKAFTDHPGGTLALADVSLTVSAGEFVSVVGPSGCGKSTLLSIVADLVPPTSGEVEVCGHPPAIARRRREYGIVFQTPVLYQWRTVLQNVELPLELAGLEREERRRRARDALALVHLGDVAERRPSQLSGGMQQRVALARALVTRPRLLLMDEPFGALDELSRERLNNELLRIWQETGVTVLFVTHSVEEAVFLADRVVVLTARPARVAAVVPVDLPRPRDEATRDDPAFFEALRLVRGALRRGD